MPSPRICAHPKAIHCVGVADSVQTLTHMHGRHGRLPSMQQSGSLHGDAFMLQVCVFTAPLFSAFCALATFFFMREVRCYQK